MIHYLHLFTRPLLIIVLVGIGISSCNQHKKRMTAEEAAERKRMDMKPVTYKAPYLVFDTTVEVYFTFTQKPSLAQLENYHGFMQRQHEFTPGILKAIFEYYSKAYPDYKTGWTMGKISKEELEKHLPTPTTAEALRKFIIPTTVYLQEAKYSEPGTMGIEFDCTWDIENALGVRLKNWKVVEVGVAGAAYMFERPQ